LDLPRNVLMPSFPRLIETVCIIDYFGSFVN
jgi:hypothetical protein